jgi:hypothetical protein
MLCEHLNEAKVFICCDVPKFETSTLIGKVSALQLPLSHVGAGRIHPDENNLISGGIFIERFVRRTRLRTTRQLTVRMTI